MKRFFISLLAATAMTTAFAGDSLRVMSFNIRYDNSGDSNNGWTARRDKVTKTILSAKPDVLGTQEVLAHQFDDLRRTLKGYGVVGCGRDDGKRAGEYAAVWYDTSRWQAVDSGNFWLSATPEIAGSLGWDGACVRMASWVLLRNRLSGHEFIALNTHLDHVGAEARRRGVELILSRLKEIAPNRPAVVTGDFNSGPGSTPVRYITDPAKDFHLVDSRSVAHTIDGPAWTFHDFGREPLEQREIIDYVFITPGITVHRYTITDNTADEPNTASDHCPVTVDILLP